MDKQTNVSKTERLGSVSGKASIHSANINGRPEISDTAANNGSATVDNGTPFMYSI